MIESARTGGILDSERVTVSKMEGRGSTAEPGRAELTYGDYEEGTRRMRQEEVFGKLSNWR